VAQAAGAGEIGTSAFLLHPVWGPWIHLRILATAAPSRDRREGSVSKAVCTACGTCVSACPAGAIREESFDGLACRRYRQEKGEYVPVGPDRELHYCTLCADVCPVGRRPGQAGR
jgi:epoxyqueuosine reductase QueG